MHNASYSTFENCADFFSLFVRKLRDEIEKKIEGGT